MKKSLLLATTAIIASAGVAANAHAVDVQMYGQVNKGIMMSDDGQNTQFNVVDNDVSSTRFGVRGSQQLDNGLTASALLEMEATDNSSDAITTANSGSQADVHGAPAGFTTRHARVGLAGNWGAVFVGRTSTATDGVTEVDLGPVQDVMTSGMNRIGGGLNVGGTGGTISSYVDNFNGIAFSGASSTDTNEGFADRLSTVRYDSPIVSGFQARVAAVTGGDYDAAVYYNGKVNDFQVAGGVGYVGYNGTDASVTNNAGAGTLKDQISGSVSVKHSSGVSLTAAYGQRDYDNKAAGVDTPYFYYAKLGYAWNKWGFGVDYGHYKGINLTDAAAGDSNHANAYGAGVQYDLGHGVSASAYYQAFKVKSAALTNDDTANLYGVNLRVKF